MIQNMRLESFFGLGAAFEVGGLRPIHKPRTAYGGNTSPLCVAVRLRFGGQHLHFRFAAPASRSWATPTGGKSEFPPGAGPVFSDLS